MHTLEQLQSGALTGTTHLKLSCGLTYFPIEILELANTLEVLDLSGNEIRTLPEEFAKLTKLRIVFLSNNPFTEFPAVLGKCNALEMIGFKACQIETVPENAIPTSCKWLILTDNKITQLPASIGNCTYMQKLMLAGNQLKSLPAELANCQNLELLRISANQLTELPDWLYTLPKLAWLAFAGNPCSTGHTQLQETVEMAWQDLEVGQLLGEGASGLIYKAHVKAVNATGLPGEVAVKVFKGAITSDGLPEDEVNACLVAGAHEHLVETVAVLTDHPEQGQGLVMALIPKGYKNLGGPPSFATITRDTFAAGTTFTLKEALVILKGMASVARHLHANGVMHGDLYAHNTLVNEQGNPLFGDFGAATLYDRTNQEIAPTLERLEVRAFGCLLEDVLDYVTPVSDKEQKTVQALESLCSQCLQPALGSRPLFSDIEQSLGLL